MKKYIKYILMALVAVIFIGTFVFLYIKSQPQPEVYDDYFEQCRSHPPLKGDVSRASSRASWKTPLSDKPRALPPGGKETPRSIAQRPPDACGRPQSTPSAHGTGRLQPGIASVTISTAATVEPASRRRCVKATTPGAGTLR